MWTYETCPQLQTAGGLKFISPESFDKHCKHFRDLTKTNSFVAIANMDSDGALSMQTWASAPYQIRVACCWEIGSKFYCLTKFVHYIPQQANFTSLKQGFKYIGFYGDFYGDFHLGPLWMLSKCWNLVNILIFSFSCPPEKWTLWTGIKVSTSCSATRCLGNAAGRCNECDSFS